MKFRFSSLIIMALVLVSCGDDKPATKVAEPAPAAPVFQKKSPAFNADSAYIFVEKQVGFGHRFPGSKGHKACADWMHKTFELYADKVYNQEGEAKNWDGKMIKLRNIIASFNPDAKERIMISAHWDSRPYADHDPEPGNHNTPILAADDGGSGIAVMLEMARAMAVSKPSIGVDFVCFDAEDLGKPDYEDSYCLGSQYWARKPHLPDYKARYAVNLDMVGAKGARFVWEGFSVRNAENVLRKIWDLGVQMGYSNYYFYYQGGAITDDHYYVNKLRGIPAVDIIHFSESTPSGFPAHWHTLGDNMAVIDRQTLKAVGEPLLEVIYREQP
ncbi:MAG: M28 family peptidase [Bacteroidetes bacterium]|nr:M28 family peptidase [Bacteroidota bacterium]